MVSHLNESLETLKKRVHDRTWGNNSYSFRIEEAWSNFSKLGKSSRTGSIYSEWRQFDRWSYRSPRCVRLCVLCALSRTPLDKEWWLLTRAISCCNTHCDAIIEIARQSFIMVLKIPPRGCFLIWLVHFNLGLILLIIIYNKIIIYQAVILCCVVSYLFEMLSFFLPVSTLERKKKTVSWHFFGPFAWCLNP